MPAPSPHGSRRAVLSHRALQTASLPQLTTAIPRREVRLVDPALHGRPRFPLQAVAACQPLPNVNGPTVSEYYGLIRLPKGLRLPYHFSFRVRLPAPGPIVGNPMYRPSAGTHRVSQVPDASLHTHRPDVLRDATLLVDPGSPSESSPKRSLCVGFWLRYPIAACIILVIGAVSRL